MLAGYEKWSHATWNVKVRLIKLFTNSQTVRCVPSLLAPFLFKRWCGMFSAKYFQTKEASHVSNTHIAVLISTCSTSKHCCMTGVKRNNAWAAVEPHTHFTVHRKFKLSPAVDAELVELGSLSLEIDVKHQLNGQHLVYPRMITKLNTKALICLKCVNSENIWRDRTHRKCSELVGGWETTADSETHSENRFPRPGNSRTSSAGDLSLTATTPIRYIRSC